MRQSDPVAFLDSGIGGLTVVKEFFKLSPWENILYIADEANMPYGNKPNEEILNCSLKVFSFLNKFSPKLIVVACGTIGSVLGIGKTELSGLCCPILRVIEPSCSAAAKITKNKRIGILATKATVNTHSYREALIKIQPNLKIFEKDCPNLASIIEEKIVDGGLETKSIYSNNKICLNAHNIDLINGYLAFFDDKNIDVLILGCTHYPLVKDYISNILNKNISILDVSKETAEEAFCILNKKNLILEKGKSGNFEAYTTGCEKNFYEKAKKILTEEDFGSFSVKKLSFNGRNFCKDLVSGQFLAL